MLRDFFIALPTYRETLLLYKNTLFYEIISIKVTSLLAAVIISLPSFGQGLKAFKLKNGLSVYIWEDVIQNRTYSDW